MQPSQGSPRPLLTALEVQQLLHIDRSTVYRMAEDGRLPAIRVGRSWRFPAERIEALLAAEVAPAAGPPALSGPTARISALVTGPTPAPTPTPTSVPTSAPGLDLAAARAAVDVAAELLGVMMVVTDMHGRPVTEVANPCPWFAAHARDPGVLDACVAEWHDLADHPDLTPRFQQGALGFQCARAFVREASTLVGMVLAGGVSPASSPQVDPDLFHLDEAARSRVLAALPRIAAAISTTTGRPAVTPTPTAPVGATKEI